MVACLLSFVGVAVLREIMSSFDCAALVQIRGDPKQWLPTWDFPLYRHSVGNVAFDISSDNPLASEPPPSTVSLQSAPYNLYAPRCHVAWLSNLFLVCNPASFQNAMRAALQTIGDLSPVAEDIYQPINVDTLTSTSYNFGSVPPVDIDGQLLAPRLAPDLWTSALFLTCFVVWSFALIMREFCFALN